MQQPPGRLEVLTAAEIDDPALGALDRGERSAIRLGLSLKADLILIDDRRGAAFARKMGFEVTGTLVFSIWPQNAAWLIWWMRWIGFKRSNFCYRQDLLDTLLKKHRDKGGQA